MAHSEHARLVSFWLIALALLAGCNGSSPSDGKEGGAEGQTQAKSTSAADRAAEAQQESGDGVANLQSTSSSEFQTQASASTGNAGSNASDAQEAPSDEEEVSSSLFEAYEVDADRLLAAALPPEQLEDGWVRLFDGQSPFGWFLTGQANWSIDDGVIRVSKGERSYLCTSFQLSDYEFKVDFRSDANTNSGIFLRTGPQPENVAEGCLELNIAPPDNPFPTGSFVERKKLEPEQLDAKTQGEHFDATQWHTYRVRLIGSRVQVFLDEELIMELTDFASNSTGHISLQFNEGRVEFRNILLKPVDMQPLKLNEDWEEDWTKSVKEGADMDVEVVKGGRDLTGGLRLTGGLGQIQSKNDYGDFFLQASYTLAEPNVNSGIFFRCIRDNMLDGYECQVNHAVENGDPLIPSDAGAGAIFRRQPARIVVGDGTSRSFVTILASGPHIVTWINGLQVVDFYDSREPDENPRRGLRTEPGPISIQAHDPDTNVIFHDMKIGEL